MTRLLVALLLAPAAAVAQDTYPQSGLEHVATKAIYSAAAYAALRELHAPKVVSVLLATVGVTLAGKGLELARGRRPGLRDTTHDTLWSAVIVLPLATRSWTVGALLGGGILITRRWSIPRW